MKIRNKILISSILSAFFFLWNANANLDYFEVTLSPDNLKAWEYLDFSIEAKDRNRQTVTDYTGMVLIFSESDPEAQLPTTLRENTYTFTAADQWKVMFENSVRFLNGWKQNIYVYDFNNDSIFWIWEVNVTKADTAQNIRIDIISPQNWLTIWSNSIKISWTSDKNHKIKLLVNWKEETTTTTNNDWIYEVEITNLIDWENTFKAQVLDWNENVAWESAEVKIKVSSNNISLRNLKTIPSEVDTEWAYEIEVISNEWLREVNVIVNDVIINLEEITSWIYRAKTFAPSIEWNYSIDLILKDELWHEKKELWAWNLKVNKINMNSAEPIKENIIEEKNDKPDLTIKWLKLVELKTRSILTWNKVEEAQSYNVYKKYENWDLELIVNVIEPRFEIEITWDEITHEYFAVKAVAEDEEWEIYEWSLSEATKIQTWPEILILFIISMLVWFLYLKVKQRTSTN